MADKKPQKNDTAQNDDQLRGGTQGPGLPVHVQVGGVTGGTNAVNPAGASQTDRGPADPPSGPTPERHGTRTDSRNDPEAAFEGSRHPSQSVAKQFARDAADADTQARSPHGSGDPRYHQIHADPTQPPGSQGDNEPTAPASHGESTGEQH